MMKKIFLYCFLTIFLTACSSHKAEDTDTQTLTVALKPSVTKLYFNGAIEPNKHLPVISKIDGLVKKMYFEYGTAVAKDQLLFVIESPQLVIDYQTALTDLLKSQRDYTQSEKQLQGSTELKKLGIISDQEYQNDRSQNFNASITLAQAKHKFEEMLKKFDTPPIKIEEIKELAKSDPSKLAPILTQSKTTVEIYSPATGNAMPGEKSSASSGDLRVGSAIKSGQILTMIGVRTGIVVNVKVSELNIEDIATGQEAIITGDGFPNITLKGNVFYKERLPTSSDGGGGGTPMYLVHILVPQITFIQREKIRLGMSARVEITITKPPVITIPISAVTTQGGRSVVKILDPHTEEAVTKTVTTGATSENSVEILSGLKSGDKVIINDTPTTTGN